jgi:predicted ATP-grasp superfamily ATP-dependent carboligase
MVVCAMSAVLVGLYEEPERPANAVDYLKRFLQAPVGVDVDALRAENERLRSEVSSLQQQLASAQQALALGQKM